MAKKILFPEDAKSILSDVNPAHKFNLHMGTSIANLGELAEALEIMDDTNFKYHVTKEKNDFSSWVRDIIGDIELSNDLMKAKTRKKAFELVSRRIEHLRELKNDYPAKEKVILFNNEFFIGLLLGLILGFLISAIIQGLIS